jgi:hypothetical protein
MPSTMKLLDFELSQRPRLEPRHYNFVFLPGRQSQLLDYPDSLPAPLDYWLHVNAGRFKTFGSY